ncbi:hypothetical protein B0J17DRAFT_722026 [Rhizoctonia solani]|nr:hypothetical protein B0J17DRAFT_722026 [Rhizoctonia solani]
MSANRTLAYYRVEHEDEIDLMPIQRGGKPVIYLLSPCPIANDTLGKVISWAVDTRPEGLLFDRLANREVVYLFWEAQNPKLPISPPTTPSAELVAFDPARPTLHPSNSALPLFDIVTGYIGDALLAIELHTEVRTSFITLRTGFRTSPNTRTSLFGSCLRMSTKRLYYQVSRLRPKL